MIKKNKPIGCRAFHFTRKVGKADVCFYCNVMFVGGILIHQGNIDLDQVTIYKPKT
jgi:hypothetical protein